MLKHPFACIHCGKGVFSMVWKIDIKKLIISLVIPLAVGGLSALITGGSMDIYGAVTQPPLSPPGWVFPVVWSVLYVLMSVSLYLVWESDAQKEQKTTAFVVFGISLLLNFLWSPIFFAARGFLAAFVVLVLLWLSIIGVIITFYRIRPVAGLLQLPYLLWVTFAGYLNFGVYLLNK